MKIKGAIFDMDGTLVDSLIFWEVFWRDIGVRCLHNEHFRPTEEDEKKVRTMIFSDTVRYICDTYHISEDTEAFVAYSSQRLEDFYRYEVKLKDGAAELLSYLKSQNVRCCLASATDLKLIKIALDARGIGGYFEAVLSCSEIGIGKERPDIYLMAAEKLGCSVQELCVVEDSYIALETAKKAGFQTVGVYDPHGFEQGRLREASDIYVANGESLSKLISLINP